MLYRPEIDGLRALAVLPVVLFHAEFSTFSGGYVGVDVFFVISGYLITSIILEDVQRDRFSIVSFYERRARRILPALFTVTLACIPFAWLWMLPSDFEKFSSSVAAVSLFASNILFWQQSGYFQAADELRPLIHTWSLGVEEQFYVVFPVLLVLAWRFAKHRLGLIIGIGFALSLMLAEHASRVSPSANFYLLPTRGWELLVGGFLAYREQTGESDSFRISSIWSGLLAYLAVALILAAVFFFDESTRHPGLVTLLPVLGTAILIRVGNQRGLVNWLLSRPYVVGIGLISYSLYLWHQPIFAFARFYSLDEVSKWVFSALALFSVLLAYLSYAYVERPFRNRNRVGSKTLWITAATGSALLLVSGLVGGYSEIVPSRIPEDLRSVLEEEHREGPFLEKDGRYCDNAPIEKACVLGSPDASPTWAIIGDSHAAALAPAFNELWAEINQAGILASKAGCAYVQAMERTDLRVGECANHNAAVRTRLLRGDIENVIIAARWSQYVHGEEFDNREGGRMTTTDVMGPLQSVSEEERRTALLKGYRDSVEELLANGIRVFLIYPVPVIGWDVPYRRYKLHIRGIEEPISIDSETHIERHAAVVEVFDDMEHDLLTKIDPFDVFCNSFIDGRCVAELNGKLLYRDDDHLTNVGSKMLLNDILSRITDL